MWSYDRTVTVLRIAAAMRFRQAVVAVLLCCYSPRTVITQEIQSLLTANASLAIILDQDFLGNEYTKTLDAVKEIMKVTAREYLKYGGVVVHYYSWTSINLKRDFIAVFSIASCKDTWNLFAVSEKEHLALIALTDMDCPRLPERNAITVPIIEPGEELSQLILDLRTKKAFNWKSAALLYDETLSRDMVGRLITAMNVLVEDQSVSSVAVSVFKLEHSYDPTERRKALMKKLAELPTKRIGNNFAVIVQKDMVVTLMEGAQALKLSHPKAQWLYIVTDTNARKDDITPMINALTEGENIAFVYNVTRGGKNCLRGLLCHAEELLHGFALALDMSIKDQMDMAAQVSDEEWEAIRPTKSQLRHFLISHLQKHNVAHSACNNCTSWRVQSGNTRGFSFKSRHRENASTIISDFSPPATISTDLENYDSKVALNTTFDVLQVGYWRAVDGITLAENLFPHVAHGFRGKTLLFITYHNPPWSIVERNDSGTTITYRGLVFDIIQEMSRNMNFTYEVILAADMKQVPMGNDTMDLLENNEWSQREKDLIRGVMSRSEAFLAAAAFTVYEDETDINYTMPISVQPYTFLLARPKELSRALLFLSPFAVDTWVCLGVAVVLMGPALCLANRLSPATAAFTARDDIVGKHHKHPPLSNLHNCLWYVYGALLQQGGMYLPHADSGRLVVGTWWLVVLVVVTTYCGNLVAFLTFPKMEIPISTISEMLAASTFGITWGLRKGTFLYKTLESSDQPKYRAVLEGAELYSGAAAVSAAVQRARSGRHILIDWQLRLEHIMKKEFQETGTCDFILSQEDFISEKMALILPLNSPYVAMFNDELLRMHQVGLINKWLAAYLPGKDRCWSGGKAVSEVINHTVNLGDMQGSFFVLFLGFLFAAVVLIIEYYLRWWKKRSESGIIKPFVS